MHKVPKPLPLHRLSETNYPSESAVFMNQNDLQSLIRQGIVKQVPLQFSANQIRWGHPDGFFLKSNGQKSADGLSESHKRHCNNHPAPNLHAGNLSCHVAMAMAFYGERPTFTDHKGKPYVGICHHLIPDLLDYRPANLLCWLTREQHRIADNRQRALKTVVPDGDLHLFSYERLRELQDPRAMSDTDFQRELDLLRKDGFHRDPRSSNEIMLHEMTHHMEV